MVVKILGDENTPAYQAAERLINRLGFTAAGEAPLYTDVAIAPLLTRILPEGEIEKPAYGTLIFHPSPLPFGRGASAIKHAYRRKDAITAATWFWADKGIDTGDICEQEIIKVDYGVRPRDFYTNDVLPAMIRTLERALLNLSRGIVRRVPQIEKYSTYDVRV